MKTVQTFATAHNLTVHSVNYRMNGRITGKGYALVDSESNEHIELEPANCRGYSWMVIIKTKGANNSLQYFRNIYEVLKYINRQPVIYSGFTGFKFTK